MKNSIFTAVVIGLLFSSCSTNGERAKTEAEKQVKTITNDNTIAFNNIESESHVDWRASHLGGAQPRFGKIKLKSGEFLVNQGELTNATVVMDMGAFTVENFPAGDENTAKLKGHLQSADFFDIESYPTATFELTKVEGSRGEFTSIVTGNLTIMKVTKSISFSANINVSEKSVSIKSEDFSVNRTDWNLTYHTEGTVGVPVDYLIANDIGFTIDVTLTK